MDIGGGSGSFVGAPVQGPDRDQAEAERQAEEAAAIEAWAALELSRVEDATSSVYPEPHILSVWQMLHTPIISVFNDLDNTEQSVKTLLENIIESHENYKDILIPVSEDLPSSTMYTGFTTWLLGRLFYLMISRKLYHLLDYCVTAQVKILSHLQFHRRALFIEIIKEYLGIFEDCLHRQMKPNEDTTVSRFMPIGTGEIHSHINLKQCVILVSVDDIDVRFQVQVLKIIQKVIAELKEHDAELPSYIFRRLNKAIHISPFLVKSYSLHLSITMLQYDGLISDAMSHYTLINLLKSYLTFDDKIFMDPDLTNEEKEGCLIRLKEDLNMILNSAIIKRDDLNIHIFLCMKLIVLKWHKGIFTDDVVDSAAKLALALLKRLPDVFVQDHFIETKVAEMKTSIRIIHLMEWAIYEDIISFVKNASIRNGNEEVDPDSGEASDSEWSSSLVCEYENGDEFELHTSDSEYSSCLEINRERLKARAKETISDSSSSANTSRVSTNISLQNQVANLISNLKLSDVEDPSKHLKRNISVRIPFHLADTKPYSPPRKGIDSKDSVISKMMTRLGTSHVEKIERKSCYDSVYFPPKRSMEKRKRENQNQKENDISLVSEVERRTSEYDYEQGPSGAKKRKLALPGGVIQATLSDLGELKQPFYKALLSSEVSQREAHLPVDCKMCSSLWHALCRQVIAYVETLTREVDIDKILDLVLSIESIISCAVELSVMLENTCRRPPERSPYVFIFFGEVINLVINHFANLFAHMDVLKDFKEDIVRRCFNMVGATLHMSEMRNDKLCVAQSVISFVTLPWTDVLTPASLVFNDEVLNRCKQIKILQENVFKKITINHLLYLPHLEENSVVWDLLKYCKGDPELIIDALNSLPILVQEKIVKPIKIFEDFLNLLFDMSSGDRTLERALSSIAAKMVCVLAGGCLSYREILEDEVVYSINCVECSPIGRAYQIAGVNRMDGCASYLERFFDLLTVDEHFVDMKMVEALPHFCKHLPSFYDLQNHDVWFRFIDHPSEDVRVKFTSCLDILIYNYQWLEEKRHQASKLENEQYMKPDKKDKQIIDQNRELYGKCTSMLFNISHDAARRRLRSLQKTCLVAARTLGTVPFDCVLISQVSIVLIFIMHPSSESLPLALHTLNGISQAHNVTMSQIYQRYKRELCELIANFAVLYSYVGEFSFVTSMQQVVRALGFTNFRQYLQVESHHLLIFLLPACVTNTFARPILVEISKLLGIDLRVIIEKTFQYVYPHLYLTIENQDVREKCWDYFESILGEEITQLRRRYFKIIHNELLLRWEQKPEVAFKGLCDLAHNDPDRPISDEPMTQVEMANYLKPRFLGVLVYFDGKLSTPRVGDSIKKSILKSLSLILNLMGREHITPVRFKVLSTLQTALKLNYCNFPVLNIKVWGTFVRCIQLSYLGPLLSTVFASLLKWLDECTDEIISIFKYLVIENEEELSDYFGELYFIDIYPELEEIWSFVSSVIEREGRPSYSKRMETYTFSINHDNVDVKKFGLKYLKILLNKDRTLLQEMITGNDSVHIAVRKAVDVLLSASQDNDVEVRLSSFDCLGLIGAIDPAHLVLRVMQSASDRVPLDFFDDSRFVCNAIIHLARRFQVSRDAQLMDSFALAIQLFLQSYEISPAKNARRQNYWGFFPLDVQQVLLPLTTSCYKNTVPPYKEVPHPVFGSEGGRTFSDWATNWALKIMKTMLPKQFRELFEHAIICMKKDLSTLLFFLPFIVVQGILNGSRSQVGLIVEEMTCVVADPERARNTNKNCAVEEITFNVHQFKGRKSKIGFESETQSVCAKTVFNVIDFICRFLRDWNATHFRQYKNANSDLTYKRIAAFKNQLDFLLFSKANYLCGEYSRALMFLEQYIKDNPHKAQKVLWLFITIYAHLNEPDAILGIMAVREYEPSLEEMMIAHKVTGQMQNAALYYEHLEHESQVGTDFFTGIVECYLALDQPLTAMRVCQGLAATRPELYDQMEEMEAECLWRLNNYEKLEDIVRRSATKENKSWGLNLSKGLLLINKDTHEFDEQISFMRNLLLEHSDAISIEKGSYQEEYQTVIRLHILTEMSQFREMVRYMVNCEEEEDRDAALATAIGCFQDWNERLEVVTQVSRFMEPILCVRRALILQTVPLVEKRFPEAAKFLHDQVGKCWLASARTARNDGQLQQAYTYLLNVERFQLTEYFVEKAKLLWLQGEHDSAFDTLRRGIDKHFSYLDNLDDERYLYSDKKDWMVCAEAKLLLAIYNDETSKVDVEESIQNYQDAVNACKTWEKSLVCTAQFYERILPAVGTDIDRNVKGGEIQVNIVRYYSQSLQHGCEFLHQSLPTLITVWLDFGTEIGDPNKRKIYKRSDLNEMKTNLKKMTDMLETLVTRVPPYFFLPVYSQLISRICHPHPDVFTTLKNIIVIVLQTFPQRALWMTMACLKSTIKFRAKRCAEVLHSAFTSQEQIKLLRHFTHIVEKLTELTEKKLDEGCKKYGHYVVSETVRSLPRLFETQGFTDIMLPIQESFMLTLPRRPEEYPGHVPYQGKVVYMKKIREEINVLPSLQKPRQITFLGSDGADYMMMCKSKDDLRKDFRYMEFNTVVNNFLRKNPESRQRNLHVRTYCVVPLNEDSGLVEWVPDLQGYRRAVCDMYKQSRIAVSIQETSSFFLSAQSSVEEKRKVFMKKVLPRYPPIFDEWFLVQFPEPHKWYRARTAFIHTTAVMSMVGYILGLGDRHGENILLDKITGDTVHVDFNCLFNKGETFTYPEKVPFRLTHNMIQGMGPTGVEGIYRKSCETTLRVLRSHSQILMSVLRPFVYDPMVSWHRHYPKEEQTDVEYINQHAVRNLEDIRKRLSGIVKIEGTECTLPLSVEGQVHQLILEATDIDNLCQMYSGWAPFL